MPARPLNEPAVDFRDEDGLTGAGTRAFSAGMHLEANDLPAAIGFEG